MSHQEALDRRRDRLLSGLEVGGLRGAEIGPLSRPIVKRHESEIYYIDHCSTEELMRKYAGHEAAADVIAEVDFIWGEQSLASLLGDRAPLDYIIASHVIEHVPDLCGWLKETADALKMGGRLLLVVPDKRFTFDLFRRLSSFEEVIAAWTEHRRRPGLRPIMDHFANVVSTNARNLWDENIYEHLHYAHGPEYLELAQREFAEGKYIDVHCWVFTPWHFMKLMGRMVKEMKLPYDLRYFLTTQQNDLEFYVQLEKVNNPNTDWSEQAQRAHREANWPKGSEVKEFNSGFPSVSLGKRNQEFFISSIPKAGKVLEIGGGYNPIVTREMGFNCFSVDHASQEILVEKYTKLIDAETAAKIQPVDFICEDGDLEKAIPPSHLGTFDVCISSHNIEHIPNPIAQLQAVASLLTERGRFLMAIPDKRTCFDLMRPVTTTASWIEAYRNQSKRHSIKTRFEYEAYVVNLDKSVTWSPGTDVNNTGFASGLDIQQVSDKIMGENEYVDCHAWVFTPSSFLLMIHELQAIGLISFLPSAVFYNSGEFLVSLEKGPRTFISNTDRMRLLKQSCLEQAEGMSKIVLEPRAGGPGYGQPQLG